MKEQPIQDDFQSFRDVRQATVTDWAVTTFGLDQATSLPQRGLRLVEEAIEAAQAAGCDCNTVHRLVDYVYGRPVGDLAQELGGVGVGVLVLAAAAGLSAERCEATEIARVLSKPMEHFAARNAAKNEAGFSAMPEDDDSTALHES